MSIYCRFDQIKKVDVPERDIIKAQVLIILLLVSASFYSTKNFPQFPLEFL